MADKVRADKATAVADLSERFRSSNATLLTEYLPSTPQGLIDLGAFLALTPSCDTPTE